MAWALNLPWTGSTEASSEASRRQTAARSAVLKAGSVSAASAYLIGR